MKSRIDPSARQLMAFLERNREDGVFEFPFSFSYPKNCCESVSLILSYLIEEKYDHPDVMIVKGTRPKKYEHHFWVKAGDLHYDLTCHQFLRRRPIIGAFRHSFFFTYPEWKEEGRRDFVDRDEVIELYRQGIIPF